MVICWRGAGSNILRVWVNRSCQNAVVRTRVSEMELYVCISIIVVAFSSIPDRRRMNAAISGIPSNNSGWNKSNINR